LAFSRVSRTEHRGYADGFLFDRLSDPINADAIAAHARIS
jgi:hypothetical protein